MSTRTNEIKDGRMKEIVRGLAAEFIQKESNNTSLITVTGTNFNFQDNKAIIYFSVLPEEKEDIVTDFLKRKRSDFRSYVMENSGIGKVPYFDFEIDKGEKNRQMVEKISIGRSGEVG
jgi:ribosome-binding factor A